MAGNPGNITRYRWKKGQSGNPGGRTAGFRHFTANLFAQMLDARVDEDGNPIPPDDPRFLGATPFPVAALSAYMRDVISGAYDAEVRRDFVSRILPAIGELDAILMHQRSTDLRFMSYSIFRHLFDEQQQLLLTTKPIVTEICGRRWGKTTGNADFLVDRAINHNKGAALYLGRTAKSAFDMIWSPLNDTLKMIGMPFTPHIAMQNIELPTGVKIMIRGRATKDDLENLRGNPYFAVVVDEVQSDPPDRLRMLVEDILQPAGSDFEDSQIVLSGTPSRIPGNYAEEIHQGNRQDVARISGNMSQNPHLPAGKRDLERVRLELGFSSEDPTWKREYLGIVGSYDTEALVFRLQPGNHYAEADLVQWINSQPITDIFLVGGLDYGFDDYDSAAILMASESRGERFVLAEYKGNRTGTADFGNELKRITNQVLTNPILSKIPNRRFTWFCDTEGLGKKITVDLAQMYGLSVQPAYQGQPDLMVEMMQDDVKQLRLKVREKQTVGGKEIVSPFEDETYKIVFARDANDHLTRRIDDEIFHPEIMKSVQYGMRYVWLKSKVKPASSQKPAA